jgi:membrane-associated phospholipid phosphatase
VSRGWPSGKPGTALGLVSALAVFAGSAALTKQGLAPGEEATFVAINSLPGYLYVAVWPFMQYGLFLTIPVLALIAALVRRFRLAITMAVAGVGVYLLARLIKEVVKRGRPEALIEEVEARENFATGSLGFPSGHAAVAAALTVVVTPYLRGRWRIVPAALLVIVCVGRMYVAAHTPLDLIGGAALGAAAGYAANLLIGPVARPSSNPAIETEEFRFKTRRNTQRPRRRDRDQQPP